MFLNRLLMLLLAFFLGSSVSSGQDFSVGELVIVAAESVDVMTGKRKMGTVPSGTKFKVRKINASWVLGEFKIGQRTVSGWVKRKAVRHATLDPTETKTHEFNWENLLIARVKLDKDFDIDAHVDDYLKAFRPKVWKQIRNDEFQLGKNRAEAKRIFQERIDEFDLKQDFMIQGTLTFEKFNFERSAFPIVEATAGNYWYERCNSDSDFPERFKVFYENPSLIAYVPMEPDVAESFINTRKDKRGDVNRRIYAKIRIRIRSIRDDDDELSSEIRWAQFFSDNRYTKLLYETPKPPPEAPAAEEDEKSDEGGTSEDDADG